MINIGMSMGGNCTTVSLLFRLFEAAKQQKALIGLNLMKCYAVTAVCPVCGL